MLNRFETRGQALLRRHRPLLLESLNNRLCRSTSSQRPMKRYVLIATLIAIVMTAFGDCGYADVFVGSRDSNSILRYNEATGAFIDEFVSSGSGGLDSPRSLLLGRDGNLYVSSGGTDSVMRYDGTTGAPSPAAGQMGAVFASGNGLEGAAGMIVGRDGNLYVVSQNNNGVLRYDGKTGASLDVFIDFGSGGLDLPRGLVFGPDGNLYVVSENTNSVMRYDGTTGAPLPAPGQMGAVFASGGPAVFRPALVFGPDANLYVAQHYDDSIARFNGLTGEFMDTFVAPGSGGLSGPAGLVFGPDNNLYVCSNENQSDSVLRYDGKTGAFIDAFIPTGSGGLNSPVYLFFTDTDPTTLAYGRGPASHFLITAAPNAVSGRPLDVRITALGTSGNIDINYQGTVIFSTTDPDPGVVLPADYTFTAGDSADNGVHTFPGEVTLVTLGDQTIAVTDTVSGFTGTVTITVGPGP